MTLPLNPRLMAAGRRFNVCRLIVMIVAALVGGLKPQVATASEDGNRQVSVTEERGVYSVTATFTVPQSPETVFTVLTDYAEIPRFTPQMRASVVRERGDGRAVVEQEAIAKFLMFSRRIHLVLAITEGPAVITFRDVCGESFHQYEGVWRLERIDGHTRIQYTLTAKPSFAVPEFLLSRLLKRDATQMLRGLQAEMVRRGV